MAVKTRETEIHFRESRSQLKNIVKVVLFSGGRGSRVLSKELINHPQVRLTLAVNGYDDGASTGEIRRYLGDCLGPSDFRKNASRMARELRSCQTELIDILDFRLPVGCSNSEGLATVQMLSGRNFEPTTDWQTKLLEYSAKLESGRQSLLFTKLARFEKELGRGSRVFSF